MNLVFLDAAIGPGIAIVLIGGFLLLVIMIVLMVFALVKIIKIIRARKSEQQNMDTQVLNDNSTEEGGENK